MILCLKFTTKRSSFSEKKSFPFCTYICILINMKNPDGLSRDEILKNDHFVFRCRKWQKAVVDAAAARVRKTKSEFMMDAILAESKLVLGEAEYRKHYQRVLE